MYAEEQVMDCEDFYSVLSVSQDATTEEIKTAFRKKAFDHHPDAKQYSNSNDKEEFQRVLRAYETLRDPDKRAQYDVLRRRKPTIAQTGGRAASGDPSWGHIHVDEWERAFDEWAQRMQDEFGGPYSSAEAEELRRERHAAGRIARAEAWKREKLAAAANKLRSERVRRRAEDAKHARHAATLRKFWQGRSNLTWQDAVVGFLFFAITAGATMQLHQHFIRKRETISCAPSSSSLGFQQRAVAGSIVPAKVTW